MNKIKPLPIEQQIKLLEEVVANVKHHYSGNGLCGYISSAALNNKFITSEEYYFNSISYWPAKLIPSFNRTNAIRLSKIDNFITPHGKTWWWVRSNKKVRLKFIEALINQLKSKL